MGIFSLTDLSESGGGGKWQFVSQGFFRLFSPPPKTNKLSPPASGVTENSGDRENVLPKSGRLRTPGSRGAGARWRPQPNAAPRGRLQAPARPWSPPAASPRASAGRVLPLPAREGRIPPHDLWARPADPLPTRSEKRQVGVLAD